MKAEQAKNNKEVDHHCFDMRLQQDTLNEIINQIPGSFSSSSSHGK